MGGNFCSVTAREGAGIARPVYGCAVESYGVYEQLIAVRLWLRRCVMSATLTHSIRGAVRLRLIGFRIPVFMLHTAFRREHPDAITALH